MKSMMKYVLLHFTIKIISFHFFSTLFFLFLYPVTSSQIVKVFNASGLIDNFMRYLTINRIKVDWHSTQLLQIVTLVLFILGSTSSLWSQSQTFTTSGSVTIPAGVTSVTVEGWGGGGKGATTTSNNTQGGGGGGGAYSRSVLAVTPITYNYTVGAGSTTTSPGGDTWFNNASTILAKGGNSVANNTAAGASGGLSSAGIGDTKYSGGNGANGIGGGTKEGGGGGSSAGTGANGTTATNINGAIAPTGGGNGGNGGVEGLAGTNGSAPGGGGGGAAQKTSGPLNGGNGANGKLTISWSCPTYSLTTTSATDVCTSTGNSTVTLTSSAGGLPVGSYTVTYNRSLPAFNNLTASMTVTTAGTGTFTATGFSAAGSAVITITNLSSGSSPVTCSSSISSNNTASIYVSSAVPSQPSAISGSTTPCNGSSQNYSVNNVAGVTYSWIFPAGWIQTGGGTTSSVTVTTNGTAGNVEVTPSNACGTGTVQTLAINPTDVPAQPSSITGSTTPCEGSSQNYSVINVAGVTYTWIFPSGWNQTGGGTTNSITVSPSATSGNIQVTPSNNCGNGTAQTLVVTASPLPDAAGAISGSSSVDQGDTGIAYSVSAISNASSYTWNYSGSGATINGSTNNITIDFSGSALSGILTVSGTNSCGNGVVSADYPITVIGDLPSVSFTSSSQSSVDETGTMTITVELSSVSASDVTIPFTFNVSGTATGGGTDYSYSPNSPDELVITAGNTTADLTITITPDVLYEDDETIIVELGSPTNAVHGPFITHTATITDDDEIPSVTFTSASQSSVNESGTMTITAQLSAVSGLDVTVPFTVDGSSTATGGGVDYSITASPVIIAAGNTSADIIITITEDDLDESDETVIINMGTPSNAIQGATIQHIATITDDDTDPLVTFTTASQSSVNEIGTMTITVELNIALEVDVNIPFSINVGSTATDPDDYSITSSPVIITAGNTSVDITITIATDALDEYDETIIVDMGSPTNAGQGAITQHTATITDDDPTPSVFFTTSSQFSADESGTLTITLQLSAATSFDVTIPFTVNGSSTATGGGVDYTISTSPIIIPAGNTSADITITIVTDTDIEGDETVIVDMGSPTNAIQGETITHTATITDDDFPPQALTVSSNNICIGDQITFEAILTGNIACGDIVYYESSSDGGSNWTTIITVPGIPCTENFFPPTFGVFLYRYYYSKGSNNGFSNAISVIVNQLPQGSLTANGPHCGTNTGQLTWTTSAGTGPYTIVYNDETNDRTANNVLHNTPFDVFTNPVTATTIYTLVSVTDNNGCIRTSGFTINQATITIIRFNLIVSPNGTADCPALLSTTTPPFDPDNSSYNAGATEVTFRVEPDGAFSYNSGWTFDFSLTGTVVVPNTASTVTVLTLNGDDTNVPVQTLGNFISGTVDAGNNSWVDLTFQIENTPGSAQTIEFSISNANDGDSCGETESINDNDATHTIEAMPVVGAFD